MSITNEPSNSRATQISPRPNFNIDQSDSNKARDFSINFMSFLEIQRRSYIHELNDLSKSSQARVEILGVLSAWMINNNFSARYKKIFKLMVSSSLADMVIDIEKLYSLIEIELELTRAEESSNSLKVEKRDKRQAQIISILSLGDMINEVSNLLTEIGSNETANSIQEILNILISISSNLHSFNQILSILLESNVYWKQLFDLYLAFTETEKSSLIKILDDFLNERDVSLSKLTSPTNLVNSLNFLRLALVIAGKDSLTINTKLSSFIESRL